MQRTIPGILPFSARLQRINSDSFEIEIADAVNKIYRYDRQVSVMNKHRYRLWATTRGITMIEVIMVMLLLGTLSLVAVGRTTNSKVDLITTADMIGTHVRLVQSIAMNSSPGVWGIQFESGPQSYYMFHCDDPENCNTTDAIYAIPGSDVNGDNRTAVSGGTVRIDDSMNVAYDGFGKPHHVSGGQASAATAPITLSLTDLSGNSHAIQIAPKTGFIP